MPEKQSRQNIAESKKVLLSINTNLNSLITQRHLAYHTDALATAMERLSTGFKINHAKDNAAGYSIANRMNVELSSYETALNNISMGMDMLDTAQGSLGIIKEHLQRIRDLCEQASNGTYGNQSRDAIQSEIDQRTAEIKRIINTAEYNGIKLLYNHEATFLEEKGLGNIADITANKGPNGKFIEDIVEETPDVIVSDPTQLLNAIKNNKKIGISNAETMAELAKIVNGTDGYTANSCWRKTIILTEDIDLSGYHTGTGWTPIGGYGHQFAGTFNGNGHVVSNLYINNPTASSQALFGAVFGEFKNVGIENCEVIGDCYIGGLWGIGDWPVTNCYVTGSVNGRSDVGGLVGHVASITNCYSTASVKSIGSAGSLAGSAYGAITNSYATGNVNGRQAVGGLIGQCDSIINCYATGSVSSDGPLVGGLVGNIFTTITNSYATGNVSGSGAVGGLAGQMNGTIINCYSTGNVSDLRDHTGGLAGTFSGNIINSVSFANEVSSKRAPRGSLVGNMGDGTITDCNCYEIEGLNKIGNGGTEEQNNGITYTTELPIRPVYEKTTITLQVGIDSSTNSTITFDTALNFGKFSFDATTEDSARSCLDKVDNLLSIISSKQTEFGATQNRLESALESTEVSINNLTSSLSTIRDTDVAKESSEYIKHQILQQACATLLATANQSPSIALQLI